jgi:RNA polymerase sigma-70 factor (ECF subfamily)
MNPGRTRPRLEVVAGGISGALEELSDDQLMLLLERQERSFEVLVRRHQPLVLAYATRFLGDRDLAREITQEVFLTLWAERRTYSPQGKFRSYLLTLAVNRCRSLGRRRQVARRQQPLLQSGAAQLNSALPIDELLEAERASLVQARLQAIEEPYREVLLLRFCGAMSYQEMASVTGKPEGTLKSLVSRGLKHLWSSLPRELRA